MEALKLIMEKAGLNADFYGMGNQLDMIVSFDKTLFAMEGISVNFQATALTALPTGYNVLEASLNIAIPLF